MAAIQSRSFKLSDDDIKSLDRIAAAWADRSPTGVLFTRTDVIRVMIRDAVDRLGELPSKKAKKSVR